MSGTENGGGKNEDGDRRIRDETESGRGREMR